MKPTTIASDDGTIAELAAFATTQAAIRHSLEDAAGNFRTTPAARYLEPLCEALATKFVDWFCAKFDSGDTSITVTAPSLPWEHLLSPTELLADSRYKAGRPQH